MDPRRGLARRLAKLERNAALRRALMPLTAEEREAAIWRRLLPVCERLWAVLPPAGQGELQSAIADAPDSGTFLYGTWPGRLIELVEHGRWVPAPVPVGLVEVLIADPAARLYEQCGACRLPLPSRSGYWTGPGIATFVQGPLWYFADCPACGSGERVGFDGRPVRREGVPATEGGGWRFHDTVPARAAG